MSGGCFNYLNTALQMPRHFLGREEEVRGLILGLCGIVELDVAVRKTVVIDSAWFYYLLLTQSSSAFMQSADGDEQEWFDTLFNLPRLMPVRLDDQTYSSSLWDVWYEIERHCSGDSSRVVEEMRRYSAQRSSGPNPEQIEEMGRFLLKLSDPELVEALRMFFI